MTQLSDLYDADKRVRDPEVRWLASQVDIPHPLNNVQYADGISLCRHARRHQRWQPCAQDAVMTAGTEVTS